MSKPIAKITVQCPHCKAEQLEPEAAKSTFCRRCSQYFAITPASLGQTASAAPVRTADKPRPAYLSGATREQPAEAPGAGFKFRLGDLISNKPKQRVAQCFECHSAHEVSSTATSSTCKACGAYIDLQDYKINGSFSRNIKTRGTVYLGSKGDLSSSKIVCSEATLHGRMRGNLLCDGPVTIRAQGRLFGTIEAGPVVVEKGSDVQFSRPLKVASLEVHGVLTGHVMSASHILISRTGSLEGDVTATGFTVEKGGIYQGELTITPRQSPANASTLVTTLPVENSTVPLNSLLLGGEGSPVAG